MNKTLDFLKGIFTKTTQTTDSPSGTVNKSDIQHVLFNGILVGGAALLTYLGANLGNVDLGQYGEAVVPIVSMAIVAAVQWLKDNTKE